MLRDVKVNDLPAVVPEDDQHVQQPEGGTDNDEHIDGRDGVHVVPQESAPSRRGRPAAPDHVLGNSRLADADPKFEKFTVDPGCAPKRVCLAHLADQGADRMIYRWSTKMAGPGAPSPVGPEATSMPLDNGRRLYQHHDAQTPWPDPIEASPQDSIRGREPHSDAMLAPQNAQLMAERKDLQFQIGAIPQTRRE
jgi:hypothetical protein